MTVKGGRFDGGGRRRRPEGTAGIVLEAGPVPAVNVHVATESLGGPELAHTEVAGVGAGRPHGGGGGVLGEGGLLIPAGRPRLGVVVENLPPQQVGFRQKGGGCWSAVSGG